MKVFVTGGTGLIGSRLIPFLLKEGNEIGLLARNVDTARKKFGGSLAYFSDLDTLTSLDGFDAVINLAGEPILGKRWTKAQKERITQSRWKITEKLASLILSSANPPQVFISGSATGYYGPWGDEILTEESPGHEDFAHLVCKRWEEGALQAASDQTRVCILRTAVVMAREGGMLAELLPLFRFRLGTVLGTGKQYLPWIHIQDMIRIVLFLMKNPEASGIFNATAPEPVTNRDFTDALARRLRRCHFLRAPAFMLSLILGEASGMLLHGQRAVPEHLEKLGFEFLYRDLDSAFGDLIPGKTPAPFGRELG